MPTDLQLLGGLQPKSSVFSTRGDIIKPEVAISATILNIFVVLLFKF